jgi:hypothetical protein
MEVAMAGESIKSGLTAGFAASAAIGRASPRFRAVLGAAYASTCSPAAIDDITPA